MSEYKIKVHRHCLRGLQGLILLKPRPPKYMFSERSCSSLSLLKPIVEAVVPSVAAKNGGKERERRLGQFHARHLSSVSLSLHSHSHCGDDGQKCLSWVAGILCDSRNLGNVFFVQPSIRPSQGKNFYCGMGNRGPIYHMALSRWGGRLNHHINQL